MVGSIKQRRKITHCRVIRKQRHLEPPIPSRAPCHLTYFPSLGLTSWNAPSLPGMPKAVTDLQHQAFGVHLTFKLSFLIPVLRQQRQTSLCEFKASQPGGLYSKSPGKLYTRPCLPKMKIKSPITATKTNKQKQEDPSSHLPTRMINRHVVVFPPLYLHYNIQHNSTVFIDFLPLLECALHKFVEQMAWTYKTITNRPNSRMN